MSASALIYNAFQDTNPEKFNEDLIYMRRTEQSQTEHFFEKMFKSLKIPGITYLGMQYIRDEYEQAKYLNRYARSLEESRLDLIVAKFKLEAEGETKEIEFLQFFPKLIDDFFFQITGNRYYALYQISDKSFYSTSKALSLKTLLMPLSIKFQNASFESVSGLEYSGVEYKLDPFNTSKVSEVKNMFLYYFVEFGKDAIDYLMGTDEEGYPLAFLEESDDYEEYSGYDAFQIKKGTYLYFSEDEITSNQNFANLVCTLVKALKGSRKSLDDLFSDPNYFKKKILNTTATNVNKADKALLSLKRILDEVTKEKLKGFIDEEYTESTFAIAKYMALNFEELKELDTVDLENRRLRLFEYTIYPLLTKFSDATYRIFNSRNVNIKRLNNVFSAVKPNFIIKNLVNNELLRYYNATSTLELFSVALRYSAKGPQALGSSGAGVTIKYRAVHPSYVGVIGLSMASASDPGMTGTLCPLTRNIRNFNFELPK